MDIFPLAKSLAADLAGARVDPNEAQKALAYLRSKRDSKRYFDYLRAIVQDGRMVIRSRQTLDYYRELLAASERHLRGLPADEMAQALGWAIRLLRYYRAVPDAEIVRPAASTRPSAAGPRQGRIDPVSSPANRIAPEPPARSAAPQLPTIGAIFAGRVLAVDESAVLVAVPGFDDQKTIGVIKVEALEGKLFRVGNSARVEVLGARTLKSGKTVLELKPALKKQE